MDIDREFFNRMSNFVDSLRPSSGSPPWFKSIITWEKLVSNNYYLTVDLPTELLNDKALTKWKEEIINLFGDVGYGVDTVNFVIIYNSDNHTTLNIEIVFPTLHKYSLPEHIHLFDLPYDEIQKDKDIYDNPLFWKDIILHHRPNFAKLVLNMRLIDLRRMFLKYIEGGKLINVHGWNFFIKPGTMHRNGDISPILDELQDVIANSNIIHMSTRDSDITLVLKNGNLVIADLARNKIVVENNFMFVQAEYVGNYIIALDKWGYIYVNGVNHGTMGLPSSFLRTDNFIRLPFKSKAMFLKLIKFPKLKSEIGQVYPLILNSEGKLFIFCDYRIYNLGRRISGKYLFTSKQEYGAVLLVNEFDEMYVTKNYIQGDELYIPTDLELIVWNKFRNIKVKHASINKQILIVNDLGHVYTLPRGKNVGGVSVEFQNEDNGILAYIPHFGDITVSELYPNKFTTYVIDIHGNLYEFERSHGENRDDNPRPFKSLMPYIYSQIADKNRKLEVLNVGQLNTPYNVLTIVH